LDPAEWASQGPQFVGLDADSGEPYQRPSLQPE
jgi:hypothetical protein